MRDFLDNLKDRFLNNGSGDGGHIVLTIVLIFGVMTAIGALVVLIISLVRLKKNKRANAAGPAVLPDGVDSREAFYAAGETSERRTVIGPGMPYVPDSFSEQKTSGGPGVPYESGMPVSQPPVAQPGGVPYANMIGMENMSGRTVSVREMNRGGVPAQTTPAQPTTPDYPYAQAQQQANPAPQQPQSYLAPQADPAPQQQQSYQAPQPQSYQEQQQSYQTPKHQAAQTPEQIAYQAEQSPYQTPKHQAAQTPQQAIPAAGLNSTVNVRGSADRPATQVDRYSYAQPQPQSQPQPAFSQQQGPAGIDELVIRYTLPGRGEQTQRFAQPKEITIGRDRGNKLVLPYETVSSHHARIDCVGGEVFITNVSRSVNGLQNNLSVDRRDVAQRTKLTNGCQINLGMVPITVTWTAGSAAPATGMMNNMNNLDGMTMRQNVGVNDDWTVRGNDGMLIVSWELLGRRSSKRVNLQDTIFIGRDPADTVHIEDSTRTVSKHHLIVTHGAGNQLVVRNGSRVNPQYGKNPFFVSGQRVVDEIPFTDGMTIKAGQAMITLTREGDA